MMLPIRESPHSRTGSAVSAGRCSRSHFSAGLGCGHRPFVCPVQVVLVVRQSLTQAGRPVGGLVNEAEAEVCDVKRVNLGQHCQARPPDTLPFCRAHLGQPAAAMVRRHVCRDVAVDSAHHVEGRAEHAGAGLLPVHGRHRDLGPGQDLQLGWNCSANLELGKRSGVPSGPPWRPVARYGHRRARARTHVEHAECLG